MQKFSSATEAADWGSYTAKMRAALPPRKRAAEFAGLFGHDPISRPLSEEELDDGVHGHHVDIGDQVQATLTRAGEWSAEALSDNLCTRLRCRN